MDLYYIWMFAECGMDESNMGDVRASCPIEPNDSDSEIAMKQKMNKLFLSRKSC